MARPPDQALQRIPGRAQYELAQHGALVRLGGDGAADLWVPEIYASKWGGEAHRGRPAQAVRLRHPDADLGRRSDRAREVDFGGALGLEWDFRGKRLHRVKQGSVKYEVVYLTSSPLLDIPAEVRLLFEYPQALTWHLQPALTLEEVARGCTRPEWLVGGLVGYGSWSGRILRADGTEIENYEAGRFGYVERPLWRAGDGATVVTEQWIDGQDLVIARPAAAWLEAHSGPYTLDPTFGYTSIGATIASSATGNLWGDSAAAGSSGTLTAVTVYDLSTAYHTMGVYNSDLSSLIGTAVEMLSSGVEEWQTSTISGSVTGSSTYWVIGTAGGTRKLYYDSLAGAGGYKTSYTYTAGSLPATLTLTTYNRRISIYPTYTETATGNPWYAYAQQ